MGDTVNWKLLSKWIGLVAAIWVQSISGNNYTFGNYSADLKRVMSYTQVELNALGVAKDVGKSFGIFAGILADIFPPQVILTIGAVVGLLGYGSTWLVVSERVAPPAFWLMCIAVFMGGNSTTWMNTGVLVTCIRNFKFARGTVSGILKGYVGLSTAIFTAICSALFTGDSSAFLLLLAFVPLFMCMIGVIFLRDVPGDEKDSEEPMNFTILNIISVVTAIYLLIYTTFAESLNPLSTKLFAIGLILLVFSPVVVPTRMLVPGWVAPKKDLDEEIDRDIDAPLLGNVHQDSERAQMKGAEEILEGQSSSETTDVRSLSSITEYRKPQIGDNHSTWEILTAVDFWFLFLTFLSSIGTGIAVMNNMGQIGESLGHADVAVFISFFSIFGFFGRIGAGAVSEHFVRSAAIPRPVWMAGSKLFMILGYLMLAWGMPGALTFGSIIVGACYGVHMTIVVATSSEMFGLKNFGLTYNLLVLNLPLGSFLFSGLLAGFLYDREAAKTTASPPTNMLVSSSLLSDEATKCYGANCFKTLFIVMSCVLAVVFVMDIFLIFRLRPYYQKVYGSRQTSKSEETRRSLNGRS